MASATKPAPLAQLLESNATKDYMDRGLKHHVTEAMKACLREKPENPIAFIARHLQQHNPNRKTTSMEVEINGVKCTLTRSRHDVPSQRQFVHPNLPLVGEMDPSRDDLYKLVNTTRELHAKRLNEWANEAAIDPKDLQIIPAMKEDVAGTRGTPALPPARVDSANAQRIRLFLIAAVDKEIVFVNGAPLAGDYSREAAKSVGPIRHGSSRFHGNEKDYSEIQQTRSDLSSPRSESNAPDSPYDASIDHLNETKGPKKGTLRLASAPTSLSRGEAEEQLAAACEKMPKTSAMTLRRMGEFVSNAFATSGINVEVVVIRTADRYAIPQDLFERIDESIGLSDSAPVVPTIVACFGLRSFVFQNALTITATAMYPLREVAQFHHNHAMMHKRSVQRQAREMRNEARLVNASAYWAKVRNRREVRDKSREQQIVEFLKRVPVPPLPSNATEEERAAHEAKRQKEEERRAKMEATVEEKSYAARVARQARRSREDVGAAEVIRKQAQASGLIISSVIRGYIIRRRNRERAGVAPIKRTGSVEHLSRTASLNASVRSVRPNKRPGAKSELDQLNEYSTIGLERMVVYTLLSDYTELLTMKRPTVAPPPRKYDTWVPRRRNVTATFDGDVSSEEEEWATEVLVVEPPLQITRYRLVNPVHRIEAILGMTRNELSKDLQKLVDQFGNVSPLQREAYAMLATKLLHVTHAVFLELSHRGELPGGVVTFTDFTGFHFPQFDEWFAAPWLLAEAIAPPFGHSEPHPVPAGSKESLLASKASLLVYDSGAFDISAHHDVSHHEGDEAVGAAPSHVAGIVHAAGGSTEDPLVPQRSYSSATNARS
jgi:hypothetical protein